MNICSKSDVGIKRKTNQDAYFAGELSAVSAFAVVCDGMGGANAGNVASETAVKIISEYVLRSYRTAMDSFEIEKMLKNAIESANIEVYSMAQKDENLSGMGTTAVIALIQENTAVIAHVGDSRAYLVSDELTQITRDHSVVQSLLESGKISAEDAKVHPRKNVITRALGAEETVIADSCSIDFKEGQKLLLCTDGLSSFVDANEIFTAFKERPSELIAEELINLANNVGGSDNITAVILG